MSLLATGTHEVKSTILGRNDGISEDSTTSHDNYNRKRGFSTKCFMNALTRFILCITFPVMFSKNLK